MTQLKQNERYKYLSVFIIVCGLLYIFAYQFKLPFKADLFLYGMAAGLALITLFNGQIVISLQVGLFLLTAIAGIIGLAYTSMPIEGQRESILFVFFVVLFCTSLANAALVKRFVRWIYYISILVVLSSILHSLIPTGFNLLMRQILRKDAFQQLMWSYSVDSSFAGITAYTPNTTFSAAIVFGYSFLNLVYRKEPPVIKSKLLNLLLLALSLFCIILCSKRGIFAATLAGLFVLLFYLYLGKNFFGWLLGISVISTILLLILYYTNDFVAAFFDRFTADDITTGRDAIYTTLLSDFWAGNVFIGNGTGATYALAGTGAHNIYLQILYDHGLLLSFPYYIWMFYNYYLAFKYHCPLSIFVQTMFLVYGLFGNPLYSNMFMIIYIYYVLYAVAMPPVERTKSKPQTAGLRRSNPGAATRKDYGSNI